MQVSNPFSFPANQDRKHFELGASPARPAAGYFADVAGLPNEDAIREAVASLSNSEEIMAALYRVLGSRLQARSFMKWRMGIEE